MRPLYGFKAMENKHTLTDSNITEEQRSQLHCFESLTKLALTRITINPPTAQQFILLF
jgi:hypothetical protein